jgi:LysM repeat protein
VTTSATHTVAKGESLWSISHKYGITIDELTAANQLAKTASLHLGQKLTVPAKAAATGTGPVGDSSNSYTVASGDTLGSVARKQGTSAAALRTANNLKGDTLRIGQKLVIPGNTSAVSTDSATSAPAAAVPSARPAPQASDATHTVVPGDSLGSIARKHGVRVGDLATLNNITDPAKIRVGQTLKLPVGAKPISAKTPKTKPAAPAATSAEPAAIATPATPVSPVTPVQTMAVPVIRID